MTNRCCIVIPHFRHHKPLSVLLPKLVGFDLDIFIIDDASGEPAHGILENLALTYDHVHLVSRPHNGGKGAAMITGLHAAAAQGFTHVISLDADGQHNPDDVPRLQALSSDFPDSLISGRPLFGDDIPASRLYGRMITNTLVQIVTGSRMIKDAMCGLRVYPIAKVLPLCDTLGYRTRMEFDVEILVRACWAGLDIRAMDTDVIYPEDGESHFDLFKDNLRLVVMHILLILGGLARLPKSLWRRLGPKTASS